MSVMFDALVLKTAVITGWNITEDISYVTILTDQLQKKAVDDYQNINADEFEYAMRAYGTKIKDWGKSMNLALIDDAICEYLGKRRYLSELESQKRANEAELPALPAGATDWSEEWEKVKQAARNGQINSIYISTCIYDWLLRNKMITLSGRERWQILEDCRQAYALEIKEAMRLSPAANPEGKRMYELLVKDGDDWRQDERLWVGVVNYSKQHTVRIEAQNAIMNE